MRPSSDRLDLLAILESEDVLMGLGCSPLPTRVALPGARCERGTKPITPPETSAKEHLSNFLMSRLFRAEVKP